MSLRGGSVEGAFRVGEWSVEPARYRLVRDGETLRLEPKVMAALVHLAERAPEVVSPEELRQAVWGTPYVAEDLPRRAVYELRKAFGDDPRRPEYIETIPRSGYRLVAPVTRPAAAGSTRATRWRRLAAPVAAAALVAAIVSLGLLRGALRTGELRSAVVPLTARPGLEFDPAFSPDGTRVAYLSAPHSGLDAPFALEVQLVAGGPPLRLTDGTGGPDELLASPAWSPDGTWIAFLRHRPEEGWAIYRVPALGGAARRVLHLGRRPVSGLAWSPDGRSLAVGIAPAGGGPLALHRVALKTLETHRLTAPPATIRGDHLPAWSPDGASVAFVRTVAEDSSEVRVVSVDGGGSRALLPERHKVADVDWSADGRRLFLAVYDGGRHRVWSVEIAGGLVRPRPELGEDVRWLSAARTGGRVACGRARWRSVIRRYGAAGGGAVELPELSSTFYDADLALTPARAPAGTVSAERLALVSTRSGSSEVWVTDLAGHRPMRLTSFGGAAVGHPRWLADGRSVVFHADPEGRFDLWMVGSDGDVPRRLTGADGDDRVPSVSRDGRSVYFASDRGGSWQVWRLPLAGGEPVWVTRGGGYRAQESPDGAWLYFTRRGLDGLWRVPVAGGEEERVFADVPSAGDWGNWAVGSDGVHAVARGAGGEVFLARLSPESGELLGRTELEGVPVPAGLALAPDGSYLLLAETAGIESDVVVVDGVR